MNEKHKAQRKKNSFIKILWQAGRKDILLAAPWLPVYSLAEMFLALSAAALLQFVFVNSSVIKLDSLLPGQFKDYIHVSPTFSRHEVIFLLPGLVVFSAFVKLLAGFMSSYLTERAGHKIAHSLREEMLQGFLNSSGNRLDRQDPDTLANSLMQDTVLLQSAISKGTVGAIRDALVLIGIIISMLLISWQTFIFGVCFVIPLALLLNQVARKLNLYTREGQKRQIEISGRILLTHHGILTVNVLRSHLREKEDFEKLNLQNYLYMKSTLFLRTFFSPAMEFTAMGVLALIFSLRLSKPTVLEATTLTSMMILMAFSIRYIKNIAGTMTFLSETSVVFRRVKKSLDEHFSKNQAKTVATLPSGSANAVIAKEITYVSADGKKILENCSLSIPHGRAVVLTGHSGAGKTTFLRILAGLLEPSQGEVSITPNFLLTPQTPYVFKGTVLENIVYAQQNQVPPSVAINRAKQLTLDLRLAFSPSGAEQLLNKRLGFLGSGLSGGEKARVALARTLFVQPDLILLDEPTANLDAESSAVFWAAIEQWRKQDTKRTVIAISHVLTELKHFDYYYLFEEGKMIKQGLPSEIFSHV